MNETLSSTGLKSTRARTQILEQLEHSALPLSAQDLAGKIINCDNSTLYRNLKTLVEKKLINEIHIGKDRTFYEGKNKIHHHHVICTDCAKIADTHECDIDHKVSSILKKLKNFKTITMHSLEFFGLCIDCAKK